MSTPKRRRTLPPAKDCGSSEDSSDESSAALEVVLDDEGRISGSKQLNLNYDFSSCNNSHFLSSVSSHGNPTDILDALKQDVNNIFDGCTTFWVPARGFQPRTTFERLALQIFNHHTRNIPSKVKQSIDWGCSGAEYWTQRREILSADGPSISSSDGPGSDTTLRNDKTMIRFHWDKDEELVDQTDGAIYVNPQISTVTYLTDGGSPTVVLPHRHFQPQDTDKASSMTSTDLPPASTSCDIAFVSYPKLGKHVSFDGRYLHGCPSALSIDSPPHDSVRMTFLVNIWINWKPLGPELFPSEHLSLLSDIREEVFSFGCSEGEKEGKSKKKSPTREVDPTYRTVEPEAEVLYTAYFGPHAWDNTLQFSWSSNDVMRRVISTTGRSSFAAASSVSIEPTDRCPLDAVPAVVYTDGCIEEVIAAFKQNNLLIVRGGCALITHSDAGDPFSSLSALLAKHPQEVEVGWADHQGESRGPHQFIDMHSSSLTTTNSAKAGRGKRSKRSRRDSILDAFSSSPWLVSIASDASSALYDDMRNAVGFEYTNNVLEVKPSRVTMYYGSEADREGGDTDLVDLPDEERPMQHMHTCTHFTQRRGCSVWSLSPDVSQDWSAPPPVLYADGAEAEYISVCVQAGDLLVVNEALWRYSVRAASKDDETCIFACSSQQGKAGGSSCDQCFGVAQTGPVDCMMWR